MEQGRPSRADRFWAKVSPEPTSGCFLWTGAFCRSGYGNAAGEGRHIRGAHRVAWELTKGPIPNGLWVLHKCDVPACVNPDHLFLGTGADNVADMVRKGRGRVPRGVRHPRAKLTPPDVLVVRSMLRAGVSACAVARRFGVTEAAVRSIRDGRSWAHVREEAA
jgi:hypothetical protein